MSPDGTYTIGELADLADITPRTIRYYVAQGLLASPTGAGPGARYDEDHLRRLRLIRRLQSEHLPLAEIRKRIGSMTAGEIEAVLAGGPDQAPGSALDYVDQVLGGHAARQPSLLLAVATPPGQAAQVAVGRVAFSTAASAPGPAPLAERSQWDRIQLDPDVELHVRRPLSRIQHKRVERLVELARQILEEDPT
jgi:DNA-binding transcriptional MerR regulator